MSETMQAGEQQPLHRRRRRDAGPVFNWPVMPVVYAGFMLKPAGFFEQNPAMDVAPPRPRHQCCE